MLKLLYILIAVVMLGFIVTIHEFGHYLVGRLCGIGIVEFSVGFGPKIISFERKGILYSVRCIPLGGYCSFVGEDQDHSAPNAMNNQPVWKRFLTVLAGPAMNFVIAFIFGVILLTCYMTAENLPRISQVYPGTSASICGIEAGDIVTEVNGTPIPYSQEGILQIRSAILDDTALEDISITVDRHGETRSFSIVPQEVTDEATGKTVLQIGVAFGGRHFRLGEALPQTFRFMWNFTGEMLGSLRDLVFKGQGIDQLSGPVGIISLASDYVYSEKLYAVVYLIFLLSLDIGIMNLLPLPALDGGRLVFLIVEAVRRKPIPPEKEGMVHAAGMMLLLALIVFITYKDIYRLITGG